MSKPKNQIKETEQQKAFAEVAAKQLADYKDRWLPVQQQLAKNIVERGKPGSDERADVSGRASTDSAVQFGLNKERVVDSVSDASGGLGSGRSKLAVTGMNSDEATSRGLGFVAADQAVDDAYLQGLTQLASIGKGERAGAIAGLGSVAASSGRQAAMDAELSAQRRAGNAEMIGTVAGLGISAMGGASPSSMPTPAGNGFQNSPGGFGLKNSSGGFGLKSGGAGLQTNLGNW